MAYTPYNQHHVSAMMKVARIYLRVSTNEQDLTQQAGIEQIARGSGYYHLKPAVSD